MSDQPLYMPVLDDEQIAFIFQNNPHLDEIEVGKFDEQQCKQGAFHVYRRAEHGAPYLACREHYLDDVLHGVAQGWYENGQDEYISTHDNGNLIGLSQGWYENGQQEYLINYRDGQREGAMQSWHANGKQQLNVTYRSGQLDGTLTGWYENGKKSRHEFFVNGKQDGRAWSWYKNGQVASHVMMRQGQYDGMVEEWYENGIMKSRAYYEDNQVVGAQETWHKNGNRHTYEVYPAKDNRDSNAIVLGWNENADLCSVLLKQRSQNIVDYTTAFKWIQKQDKLKDMLLANFRDAATLEQKQLAYVFSKDADAQAQLGVLYRYPVL